MRLHVPLGLFFCIGLTACQQAAPPATKMTYPPSRKGDVVDDYAGTKVADPYRWMEDLDSKEVAEWVDGQNAVTERIWRTLPLRAAFKQRLTELWNYPRVGCRRSRTVSCSTRRTPACSASRRSIVARQGDRAAEAGAGSERHLSPDGSLSLAQCAPSPDARLLAYGHRRGRRRLADRARARHRLRQGSARRRPTGCASPACRGRRTRKGSSTPVIRSRPKSKVLEAALSGQAIYYHRVGTPQSEDVLIYERKDQPTWIVGGERDRGRPVPADRHLRGLRQQEQPATSPTSATPKRRTLDAPVKPVSTSTTPSTRRSATRLR